MANKIENWKTLVSKIIRKSNKHKKQESLHCFMEDDFDAFLEGDIYSFGDGKFEVLETKGTTGDDHGTAHIVFRWKDVYYKLEVVYSSYSGYDWEDAELYEVMPDTKYVTTYNFK